MMFFKAQWDISTWQPCVCFICQIFNTFLIPVGYTLTYFCGSTSAISHVLFFKHGLLLEHYLWTDQTEHGIYGYVKLLCLCYYLRVLLHVPAFLKFQYEQLSVASKIAPHILGSSAHSSIFTTWRKRKTLIKQRSFKWIWNFLSTLTNNVVNEMIIFFSSSSVGWRHLCDRHRTISVPSRSHLTLKCYSHTKSQESQLPRIFHKT